MPRMYGIAEDNVKRGKGKVMVKGGKRMQIRACTSCNTMTPCRPQEINRKASSRGGSYYHVVCSSCRGFLCGLPLRGVEVYEQCRFIHTRRPGSCDLPGHMPRLE